MTDPTLYLYTSLTAGSSHIITATSRLETILKANKIPFRAIDCATDEKARQLWGRRSKGRKIPGLVKYGQVIGDLEQVEEWNEFGELKESVDLVSDILGDTPMTDTPMPPPTSNFPPDAIQSVIERPASSRTASGTRHISISEPKDSRERDNPAAALKKDDSPLAMAMRQAGAEAAARAGQKKTSTSTPPSTAIPEVAPAPKRDSITTVPNPQSTRLSADAAVDEPSATSLAVTDSKTPAQLTADGSIRRSSADKSPDLSSAATSDTEGSGVTKSNREQVLDMRRRSSIVKSTSHLAEETHVEDVGGADASIDRPTAGSTHKGSNVKEVPKDIAAQVEEANRIKEEPEEEDEEDTKNKISATDKEEKKVTKGINPQDGTAAAADEAGVSVGD